MFRNLLLAAGVFLSGATQGQPITTYEQAVESALTGNPGVVSRFYEYQATLEARNVTRGAYLPSVDVDGGIGTQDRETPLNDFGEYDYNRVGVTITQLLFDGFTTVDLIRAAGHDQSGAYYDFLSASQEVALEATQAYLQVLQYQNLVEYAEQNYVAHKRIYDRIAERADGGVSQRVDLDQATARLALAESNLLTEITNRYDTEAEFQRVMGDLPGEDLAMPNIYMADLPDMRDAALELAYSQSPVIASASEQILAAQDRHRATRGAFMPRLDLRLRSETGENLDGFQGDYEFHSAEVVANWNLFRGGADRAARREAWHRYYAAIEARKQACLNVRQQTLVAFNNIDVLTRQIEFLETQLAAQDQTRAAYEDQFNLGRRSLLDLLDSQNEYFDTQRALLTARVQLTEAYATTLATMGVLTSTLGQQGFQADQLVMPDASDTEFRCPTQGFDQQIIDRDVIIENLDQEAQQ